MTTARLPGTRPHQIVQAIGLLWISTTLGFFPSVSENDESWAMLIVAALVMLAVTVVLSVGLWRGRNWGRIVYLILVALSFAELLATWDISERPGLERALEAVSFVADAGSFFLLFTEPAASWFQSRSEQSDRT